MPLFRTFQKIFLLIIFAFSLDVQANFRMPKLLTKKDREQSLEILGFGSASKILGNPYPLGGYSGVELGISSEFIPIVDIASLGGKTSSQTELQYYSLSFGKGLYHNVDTFFYFSPFTQTENITSYGAQIRWGFLELPTIPAMLSFIFHGDGVNFFNQVNTRTLGADLIATINIEDTALFFGIGQARSIGTFIGGADGITDSGNNQQEDIYQNHTLFGLNIDFNNYFLAVQVDRFSQSNYSTKLGMRF